MKSRVLALAVLVEIAYVLTTRFWLRGALGGADLEIAKTALRLFCAAAFWVLLQRSGAAQPTPKRVPNLLLFSVGVAFLLLTPIVSRDTSSVPVTAVRVLFAATSIAVALHEEFFYRGILQAWLANRTGVVPAIIYSNLVFALYHWGTQSLLQVFVIGCILGLVFAITRSLLLVVVLHAAYDALWAIAPFLFNVLEEPWRTCMLLVSLALVGIWFIVVSRHAPVAANLRGSHAG
jgi:membrane protease YdiL (CAAX protease family)